MNELNPPRVQFGVTDRGGEYLNKLRALAAAVDTSMDGYNTMIAARNDAVSILADITVLAQQALADIEGVRTGGISDLAAGRDSALAQMADIRTATVNQMNVLLGNADTQIGTALSNLFTERDSALSQMNDLLASAGLQTGTLGTAAKRNVGTTGDDLITAANALVNKGRNRITGAALDSARQAGAYGLSSSGPAGSYGFSTALTLQSAADRFAQLWIDSLGGFKAFIRGGNNASWQAWIELLTTHNIQQGLGQSTQYPMSQKAVTDALGDINPSGPRPVKDHGAVATSGAQTVVCNVQESDFHMLDMSGANATGTLTIDFANMPAMAGKHFSWHVRLRRGGRKPVAFAQTITWAGGVAPAFGTVAGSYDLLMFYKVGSETIRGMVIDAW